jgi:hypothetical protein
MLLASRLVLRGCPAAAMAGLRFLVVTLVPGSGKPASSASGHATVISVSMVLKGSFSKPRMSVKEDAVRG